MSRQDARIRVLKLITPSGREQFMVFTRTVTSPALQIDYGLVPASPDLRPPKQPETANEYMERLSPDVLEDVLPDHFFFLEYRPPYTHPSTPTLLQQLERQRVLEALPKFASTGKFAGVARLVRVLLPEWELAHACVSGLPQHVRHWEVPGAPRFQPCAPCARVRGRLPVFFCSPECYNAWFPVHKRDCGKTRKELIKYIEGIRRLPDATCSRFATEEPAKQISEDLTHFIRWPAERNENGCQNLLPGL